MIPVEFLVEAIKSYLLYRLFGSATTRLQTFRLQVYPLGLINRGGFLIRSLCMCVCMSTCYSAPSRFLLRGAPDYSADTESEFHTEAHEQLRVKDLPRVPMRNGLRWIRTGNPPAARHRT